MTKQTTATPHTHGWLAVFGLLLTVLLVMFATGLGLTLTIGTPSAVAKSATNSTNLPLLTQAANRTLIASAREAGIIYRPDTKLVSAAVMRDTVTTGVEKAGDFQKAIPIAKLTADVTTNLKAANTTQHVTADAGVQAAVTKAVTAQLNRARDDLMKGGWGTAYPMIVLVLQTTTIVSGILGLLVLLGMMKSAHGWRRFLRVTGRLTYGVGFFGGIAAILAGVPGLLRSFHIAGIPQAVFVNVMAGFAPTWQHLAGIVVVLGLVMALAAYLVPVDKH